MQLDVNTDALKKFAKKLDGISRSALPVAIRESLNDCAKDMKTNTLPSSGKKNFINRTQNFFKANSSFDRAAGFNINTMKATTGMIDQNLKGEPKGGNFAVKDLEEQEKGGDIKKKSFIPMLAARKGGARSLVRPNSRLQKIKKIVIASKAQGKTAGQKFIKSVYFAGKGGFVLNDNGGKETLFKVNSLNKTKSNQFKLTPLYSYDKGRSVHVKSRHFIEKAGNQSHMKVDKYFIERAERAIQKALR